MECERNLITYPTWERYTVLSSCIANLTIRQRRRIFQLVRSMTIELSNVLLPEFGFTISEFAVWYILGEQRRRTKS